MAILAGVVNDVPTEVREQASRFAAKSDSFAKLTNEERRVLDEFVKALKAEAQFGGVFASWMLMQRGGAPSAHPGGRGDARRVGPAASRSQR
jgi:hypothetical protein